MEHLLVPLALVDVMSLHFAFLECIWELPLSAEGGIVQYQAFGTCFLKEIETVILFGFVDYVWSLPL